MKKLSVVILLIFLNMSLGHAKLEDIYREGKEIFKDVNSRSSDFGRDYYRKLAGEYRLTQLEIQNEVVEGLRSMKNKEGIRDQDPNGSNNMLGFSLYNVEGESKVLYESLKYGPSYILEDPTYVPLAHYRYTMGIDWVVESRLSTTSFDRDVDEVWLTEKCRLTQIGNRRDMVCKLEVLDTGEAVGYVKYTKF